MMKNIKRKIASLLLTAVCLVTGFAVLSFAEDKKSETFAGSSVSVADYGAVADDGNDDTDAFIAAAKSGKNIYIPFGEFLVSKTVTVKNVKLAGCGSGRGGSAIIGTSGDVKAPILILEGTARLESVQIRYTPESLLLNEGEGDRVAVQTGSEGNPMTIGSAIKNIIFYDIGTAIYSPKGTNTGAGGALFETLEINRYTYRGVDMQTENRLGNTYSNIYIASVDRTNSAHAATSGFALEGSETGTVANQINVEHTDLKIPMLIQNVKNFSISSIHIEGVLTTQADMGYVHIENSSGFIGGITAYFTRVQYERGSLISFGNAETPQSVRIGTAHICGINGPDQTAWGTWMDTIATPAGWTRGRATGAGKSFRVLGRQSGAAGEYNIVVDQYSYYTYENDRAEYDTFKTDSNLKVTLTKGAE